MSLPTSTDGSLDGCELHREYSVELQASDYNGELPQRLNKSFPSTVTIFERDIFRSLTKNQVVRKASGTRENEITSLLRPVHEGV